MSSELRGGRFDGLAFNVTDPTLEALVLVTRDADGGLSATMHIKTGSDMAAWEVQALIALIDTSDG